MTKPDLPSTREWFDVEYWAPDPAMPGVQVPRNGVWMNAMTDIYDKETAIKVATGLREVYVKVRIVYNLHERRMVDEGGGT